MLIFNRLIDQVYLINFIPGNDITNKFCEFWSNKISVKCFDIDSHACFNNVKEQLLKEDNYNGILIQLLAHGDINKEGFGDKNTAAIRWLDVKPWLKQINLKCNYSLIIDASMTCFSEPIATMKISDPDVYHAAIFTSQSRSNQAFIHNKEIFTSCYEGKDITTCISQVNDKLMDAQELLFYGYIGS